MRTLIRFTLALLFIPLVAHAQLPQGWEWQNPLPHGLTIYDIVWVNNWFAIAGCENGYVMRSGNGGQTWAELRIAGGDVTSIASMEDGRIWAATGDGYLLYSPDYGASWQEQIAPVQSGSGNAEVVMFNENIGMAILPRDNVYRTTNGGRDWERVNDPYFGQDYGRSLSAKSAGHWYLLGVIGSEPRLYETTDFGDSWYAGTEFDTRGLNKLTYVDSTNGFQCRNGELLRTTNGGLNWQEMDIFGFGYVTDVVAGKRTGNRLFALSEGSVIVNASYDNGASWNVSLLDNAFGYASPMAMDFATPDLGLVAGSGGRILRTDDGGQSWNIVHGIGFLGHIIDMEFRNPLSGIALTASPTILSTSNGGERWIESIPVPGVSLQKLSMYSETDGYAYGTEDSDVYMLYRTRDGGRSWQEQGVAYEVKNNELYITPQAILADSESRIFLGISYGRLFRSTDGGATYDSLRLPSDLRNQYYSAMSIQLFSPNHVLLIAANGVAHSTDGGDTWTFNRVTTSQWIGSGIFVDSQNGFAVQGGKFSKTANGGKDWIISTNANNELVHFFNLSDGVMYSTVYGQDPYTGSIKWTHDGGGNWSEHSLRERAGWDEWFWLSPEHCWAYGYGGMIRHSGSSGVVGVEPAPAFAGGLILNDLYPNPVSVSRNGGFTVGFTIGEGAPQHAVVQVHDVLGRTLATVANRAFAPGQNVVTVPLNALGASCAGSTVFVSVTSGNQRITRRIALLP